MLKSTFDFLEYGFLGYIFASLGIIIGFIVVSQIISVIKPKKQKQIDNIIMDNYVVKKKEPDNSDFDDLPKDGENNEIEEYVYTPDSSVVNDTITYSEILSSLKGENINETVANNRRKEDGKYGIIKRKIKEKQSNNNG